MSKEIIERVAALVEDIDSLAFSVGQDTSRPELLEVIHLMMWKVQWTLDDLSEMLEDAEEAADPVA